MAINPLRLSAAINLHRRTKELEWLCSLGDSDPEQIRVLVWQSRSLLDVIDPEPVEEIGNGHKEDALSPLQRVYRSGMMGLYRSGVMGLKSGVAKGQKGSGSNG